MDATASEITKSRKAGLILPFLSRVVYSPLCFLGNGRSVQPAWSSCVKITVDST